MYTVTRKFRVPVGHRLSLHQGLCKNIHGHNLLLEVSLKSGRLNDNYMVLDFAELKEIVNKIIRGWDHTLLLNSNDRKYIDTLIGLTRVLKINGEPTAENLCYHLFKELEAEFEGFIPDVEVNFVRIWESDDAYAEYNGEG